MSLRYIHLRVRGGETNTPKPDVKGGATIAYMQLPNAAEGTGVAYHIAKCNMKDNFCKNIGRQIAGGRLIKNNYKTIHFDKPKKNSEIIKELINKYYEEEGKYWPDVKYFVY